MNELSHIDAQGNVTMVDVSEKNPTLRSATAQSIVYLPHELLEKFSNNDIHTKK